MVPTNAASVFESFLSQNRCCFKMSVFCPFLKKADWVIKRKNTERNILDHLKKIKDFFIKQKLLSHPLLESL